MLKFWNTWAVCCLLTIPQFASAQASSTEYVPNRPAVTCPGPRNRTDPCPSSLHSVDESIPVAQQQNLRSLPQNFWTDQKNLWTSPRHLREEDVQWLVPATFLSAIVIGNDRGIESHLPDSPSTIKRSQDVSNYGVAVLVAAGTGAYVLGQATGNDRMRETGWLSGEAFINTLLVTEAVKEMAGRQRPLDASGQGRFRKHGDSFPSQHAAAAWSIASVIANEYPGRIPQLLAYGAASAVTVARVTGRKHFASDALIGSALGWYVGRQVYRAHAGDSDANAGWGTFVRSEHRSLSAEDMASPFVPLDSWVYPVLARLESQDYIDTAFAGLRPWTRMECARLVQELGASVADAPDSNSSFPRQAYDALAEEFSTELAQFDGGLNRHARVESVYTRYMEISGTPLNDSFHFGQTIANDYGRPFAEGSNVITGASGWASAGPAMIYVRGEYQHAPATPPLPYSVRRMVAIMDNNPVQPASPTSATDRYRAVEAYAAIKMEGVQVSVGKQSLWWGPGETGPLMFSDNADAIPMLRLTETSPLKLPSFFHWLGPMRWDSFLGQLQGHQFPQDPWIHAEKISFKPTPNLEFGFSRSVIFAGDGYPLTSPHPFTFSSFWRSFASVGDNPSASPGTQNDVGDRRGGFDFSYRLPGLRNWVSIYSDSMTDDDPSPLSAPKRSALNPGIYLRQIPRISKLDLRVESAITDLPDTTTRGPGRFFYWNAAYHDSHTNYGDLLGSSVGRAARFIDAHTRYWLSSRRTVELEYRTLAVDHSLLATGGQVNDWTAKSRWLLYPTVELLAAFQYERWHLPALSTDGQRNVAASFQLTYRPPSH